MTVMATTPQALSGPGTGGRAVLRSTLTSPYGRKVRMAASIQ